jgi:DNA-binding transcriptional MerR regulator
MAAKQPANIFANRSGKLITIGQVLNILSSDFADLTNSKIRFLEDQGLIVPTRTESGYRKFSAENVDRIRVILELQRDQFLPLKVIKNYLEDLDCGKQPTLPQAPRRPSVSRRFTKIELLAETGISESLLAEAQSIQLISTDSFAFGDIEIARALIQLQRFGISARHLRGIKAAADRDLGIIEGVIASVRAKGDAASKSKAANFANEMESQFSLIRSELMRAVLDKIDS